MKLCPLFYIPLIILVLHLSLIYSKKTITWHDIEQWTNALLVNNKYGFVDDSLPQPASTYPNFVAWVKNNSMVISWFFNSLCPSLHNSFAFFNTTKDVWVDLEEHFSQCNASGVYQLKMDIINTQQKDQFIVFYYTKLKGLWDEHGSY